MLPNFVYTEAATALQDVQSGHRVYVHGSAQTPLHLLSELAKQKDRLRDVELVFITVQGDITVDRPEFEGHFNINCMFVSESVRLAVNEGRADFIPVFLSDIPDLFKSVMPVDVALVQVSPPDQHGYCSLGASVDIARSAVNTAQCIIAQVNPRVPRTHGDGMVHISRFTHMVWHEADLPQVDYSAKTGADELRIGELIAGMIEDGSTLQMGIGTIPDAVLKCLGNHKNLGVHTEMFSDGIVPLVQKDIINNRCKRIHPNKSVTGFAVGTNLLYDYVNDNPSFAFLDIDYVNDPHVIRRNPKVVAINSAIEIDITGQVCADSIGTRQFSGIGGQMDFMRGAALSEGGKPIIAVTSRSAKGIARIVPFLKPGAGVVTTRGHIHYVVTEYGIAYLRGKNLRQRAHELINISHPDDREMLERACFERFHKF
ncbi:acetyl-CoA hydrolase/transferase family protein [Phnomibacter ginsenosidimutans]|uniref:4-hydroxybutyrate CoA-transferase n=1 Tax=Phnomibacter ginsenosidimutans TaxID=2676868 RepID=A0A6I6GPK3_9BACT|nr:acetyl-CoA hydrolase/transferase C-terminal domain-containing protein [Phnomibacter ginsenosidimutans]QGW29608.1 4-hydroxybutyrate CoA-transferase [Phnomibacter ginsenosidimutans]